MGAFALMLFVSGMLMAMGFLMHRAWDDRVPGWAVLSYAVVLFGGAVASTWAFVGVGGLGVLVIRMSLVLFVWIPTFYVFAQLVTASLSRKMVQGVCFGSSLYEPAPSSHGRAWALLMKGDAAGARPVRRREKWRLRGCGRQRTGMVVRIV